MKERYAELAQERITNFIADTLAITLEPIVGQMMSPEMRFRAAQMAATHVVNALSGNMSNLVVVCDETNNTPSTIEQGMLNVEFRRRDNGQLIFTEEDFRQALSY